jgi:hypothetical protein
MIIQGVTLNGVRVADASVVTSDLAIWIDANNASSYGGTGTAITDLSGNSRTQNLGSASQYTVLSGVKCFDCNSNGISAASIGPTLPTTGFTYITWARMKSSSADWRTLYRSSPSDHAILIENGSNRLGMYDNTAANFYPSGYNDVSSLADVWVQWAVTGDSSGQTFYINGQQVGTTAQTAAGNSHWLIGGINNTQNFGYIANTFLYTRKFTLEQIQQNYYNQLPRFTIPNIVTSNLVLWYDPDSSACYPGTGTTVSNLASTSLSGTMSNVTYTDPYFSYNGSSSQITVADNSLLEPGTGDWTMEAWVYLSSSSGSKVVLGKFDPGGGSQDVSYSIRISGAGIYAQIGNGSGVVDTPLYTLTLNTWTHVTYVWKNVATNSLEAYINGVSVSSVAHSFSSILNTTANLYIGSYNGGEYSQYMNGRIGVTRLYSAALTSAEVLQNYQAQKGVYGL